MDKIQSESFNRVLKDKYGIEWFNGLATSYYTDGKTDGLYRRVSEHELIGIMVSELYRKGLYLQPKFDGWHLVHMADSEYDRELGNQSLPQALTKAVESVDWS